MKKAIVKRIKYWGHVSSCPSGHISSCPSGHILKKAHFDFNIPAKFKVGRPYFTWPDSLQQEQLKTGINYWEKLCTGQGRTQQAVFRWIPEWFIRRRLVRGSYAPFNLAEF